MKKEININRIINPKFTYVNMILLDRSFRFEIVKDPKESIKNSIFSLNSITDKSGNHFINLWTATFLDPLTKGKKEIEEIIKHSLSIPSSISFEYIKEEKREKRVFTMSFSNAIFYLITFLKPIDRYNYMDVFAKEQKEKNLPVEKIYRNFELFLAKYLKQKIAEIIIELKDIKRNGESSSAYAELSSLFTKRKDGSISMADVEVEIANYENMAYIADNILLATEKKQELDITDKLISCYGKDKFLLIFAKSLLAYLKERLQQKTKKGIEIVKEDYFPLVSLRNYVEETKDIVSYNPTIRIFTGKGESLYTYKKFIKEYQRFVIENKSVFPFLDIKDEELDTYGCSYNAEDIHALYKVKYEQQKRLLTNWDILPTGSLLEPREKKSSSKEKEKTPKFIITEDIIKRKLFLEKQGGLPSDTRKREIHWLYSVSF